MGEELTTQPVQSTREILTMLSDMPVLSKRALVAQLNMQMAAEELAQQARARELEEEAKRRVPRMRTARGAVELLREEDPGTAVTLSMVKRLIREGKIPYVAMGRKYLINVEILIERLRELQA